MQWEKSLKHDSDTHTRTAWISWLLGDVALTFSCGSRYLTLHRNGCVWSSCHGGVILLRRDLQKAGRKQFEEKMNHTCKNNCLCERSPLKCSNFSRDVHARCWALPRHGFLLIGQRKSRGYSEKSNSGNGGRLGPVWKLLLGQCSKKRGDGM